MNLLKDRINSIRTINDCYIVWSELQDSLRLYNLNLKTYYSLYEKIKEKYDILIQDKNPRRN